MVKEAKGHPSEKKEGTVLTQKEACTNFPKIQQPPQNSRCKLTARICACLFSLLQMERNSLQA